MHAGSTNAPNTSAAISVIRLKPLSSEERSRTYKRGKVVGENPSLPSGEAGKKKALKKYFITDIQLLQVVFHTIILHFLKKPLH